MKLYCLTFVNMYYRRKILLAFLQQFENGLEKLRLQKLVFLFSQGLENAPFHFVPYKFGCFSFQANADLGIMTKTGLVREVDKNWLVEDKLNYYSQLKETDRKRVKSILLLYGEKSADELINLTYKKYPYFAINSTIAESRLTPDEFSKVLAARPVVEGTRLYTIGYEGNSLEEYLNKLIRHGTKLLCDVRRNPLSMKYGFSKSQLKNACEGVGIAYLHLPEVGIDSEMRQNLETQQDYDLLFQRYRQECLPATIHTQQQILSLLEKHHRIALTCFEANVCQCHRKHLAEAVAKLDGFKYSLQHL